MRTIRIVNRMTPEISKAITALRFPICVLVVFIHSTMDVRFSGLTLVDNREDYELIRYYISTGLCSSAVPLFFFISGYLYFRGGNEGFSVNQYISKTRNRVKSLLVPYLLWNTLFLVAFYVAESLLSGMTSGNHKAIAEYTLRDFLMAYWNLGEGFPIDGPLWFVRDLMVLSIFAPLVYWLVKNRVLGLVVVIAALSLGPQDAYWLLGVYCALYNVDFVKWGKKFFPFTLPLWLILIVVYLGVESEMGTIVKQIYVLLGVCSISGMVSYFYRNRSLGVSMSFLQATSFFLFAFHQPILLLMCKLWCRYTPPIDSFLIAGYFLMPIMIILIAIGIFMLMKRFTPKLLSVLNGGRI